MQIGIDKFLDDAYQSINSFAIYIQKEVTTSHKIVDQ